MLQIPKRTTYISGRKAQENVLSRYRKLNKKLYFTSLIHRTWTSSDKLSLFSSNRRMNTTMQSPDDVCECVYVETIDSLKCTYTLTKENFYI
jgi:hypothetical protein